ncbi:hypothetical protein EHM76_00450 [bacterium]|nr:MAG: hypothetical protein EHM76_00450 [bacterium]
MKPEERARKQYEAAKAKKEELQRYFDGLLAEREKLSNNLLEDPISAVKRLTLIKCEIGMAKICAHRLNDQIEALRQETQKGRIQ